MYTFGMDIIHDFCQRINFWSMNDVSRKFDRDSPRGKITRKNSVKIIYFWEYVIVNHDFIFSMFLSPVFKKKSPVKNLLKKSPVKTFLKKSWDCKEYENDTKSDEMLCFLFLSFKFLGMYS